MAGAALDLIHRCRQYLFTAGIDFCRSVVLGYF